MLGWSQIARTSFFAKTRAPTNCWVARTLPICRCAAAQRVKHSPITVTIDAMGAVAQCKKFRLVTRRLWVQHLLMPLRSNPGQVACLSLFHASHLYLFTEKRQLACNKINLTLAELLSFARGGSAQYRPTTALNNFRQFVDICINHVSHHRYPTTMSCLLPAIRLG